MHHYSFDSAQGGVLKDYVPSSKGSDWENIFYVLEITIMNVSFFMYTPPYLKGL